jgi:hypothetical protein
MQQRSLGKMFVLLMVTLNIYELFWLAQTRREVIAKTAANIPPISMLFAPFGVLILLIFLSLVSRGNAIVGLLDALLGFLVVPFFYIVLIWWRWHYAKAVQILTSGRLTAPFTFWMWIITNGAWSLVLQHEFNHLGSAPSVPVAQATQPPQTQPIAAPSSTWENIRQEPAAPPVATDTSPSEPWQPPQNGQPQG